MAYIRCYVIKIGKKFVLYHCNNTIRLNKYVRTIFVPLVYVVMSKSFHVNAHFHYNY